jgi:hypothetical protein
MKPIPPGVIEATVEILGTPGISADTIEAQVAALVTDQMEARRLIDWIPEAFGTVWVAHLGKIVLPTTFGARNAKGEVRLFPYSCEPIFTQALQLAQETYHHGSSARFRNVALRSSIANAANNLLNAGGSLDGAVFHLALVGVPAEVYPAQPGQLILKLLPLWKKLLSWYYRCVKNRKRKE